MAPEQLTSRGKLCPVCGEPFAEFSEENPNQNEVPFICLRCHTLYHHDCWESLKGCVVFGCMASKAAALSVTLKVNEQKNCSHCSKVNPRVAFKCLSCGRPFASVVNPSLFSSYAGWQASTPEELIENLDSNWESGVKHLYQGDVEAWLEANGTHDWAEAAKRIRTSTHQRSVGLEEFLQVTGKFAKPEPVLSSLSLIMEGPGPTMETYIDVSNGGRGYLSGKIVVDAPWLSCDLWEFAGNKQHVSVTVDFTQLPGDEDTATIVFNTVGGKVSASVKATRIGIAGAQTLYDREDYARARILCHRLIDSHISVGDASILSAACCIHEDNESGALSALRRLSGLCQQLSPDVAEFVYNWIRSHESETSHLDKESIFAALLPCFQGAGSEKLKKELAQLLIYKASASVDSGSANASLWKDSSDSSKDIKNLLGQAAELDPELSAQAKQLKKRLNRDNAVAKVGISTWILSAILFVVAVGAALYYANMLPLGETETTARQALDNKDYVLAYDETRILSQNEPQNLLYKQQFAQAMIGRARQESEHCNTMGSESFVASAIKVAFDTPDAAPVVFDALVEWCKDEQSLGHFYNARIILENAASIKPDDVFIKATRPLLDDKTKHFWALYKISQGILGTRPAPGVMEGQEVKVACETLKKMGATIYSQCMSISLQDLDKSGQRLLVVVGTDLQKGKPLGCWAIYRLKADKLVEVFSGESSDFPWADNVNFADLSGEKRTDAIFTWRADLGNYSTTLLAIQDGKLIKEVHPCNLLLQIQDRNKDGRSEVWVPEEVGTAASQEYRVFVYSPFYWQEPGFVPANGDFSPFYRDFVTDLKTQMEGNPFEANDPRHGTYNLNCRQAIKMVEAKIAK